MTDSGAKPRRRKIGKYLLALAGMGIVILAGLGWYATTDSFQQTVRRRLVNELERVTGGKVELGSIHTVPFHFQIEIRDLTIHGCEAANQVPYAHVDRLVAQVKIISALSTEFGFQSILLDHPVVHVVFFPDGSTNQPSLPLKPASAKASIQRLFSFAVSRLEVRRGELLWQNEEIPLDFVANDISADMSYSLLHTHYVVNLLLGKAEAKIANYRPVDWTAEAHFFLGRNNLDLKSLKITGEHSHLEASGRLQNFEHPKFEGSYEANIDVAQLWAVARRREVRRGVFHANGSGNWSEEDFRTSGKFRLENLDWKDASVDSHNSDVSAQYALTPKQFSLSQIDARVMGGAVAGDAVIDNWGSSTIPTKHQKAKKLEEANGVIRLRFKDLAVAEMIAAVSNDRHPIKKLVVAGNANGNLESRWKGSYRAAETIIALDVTPPAHLSYGQMPLSGATHAVYHAGSGEIELTNFVANTRATQIRASGVFASNTPLHLSINTTDLGEWQQFLNAYGSSAHIPARLQGAASFDGTAVGKISDITFVGNFQAQNFDSLIRLSSKTPVTPQHWDSLAGQVRFSPHGLIVRNGTLHHGRESLNFDLNATLTNGNFEAGNPFSAGLIIQGGEISEFLNLLGYDHPVKGSMGLSLHAQGTRADPHADGKIQLTNAVIAGHDVDRLSANITLGGGQMSLSDATLASGDVRVSGATTYVPATRAFRVNLVGTNFDLAHVPQLQVTRVQVAGRMDFTLHSSGTLDEPIINAEFKLRNLAFDHDKAGDFTITGVTEGAKLHLTGRSQFKDSELLMDGDVLLRGDWPATLDMHFNHLNMDYLLRTYLETKITGHSAIAGDLRLQGPMRRPLELNLTGNLSDLFADLENVKVRNDGAVQFSISDQIFRINQLHLVGENTNLSAKGSVQLIGEKQIDFHAQGNVDLQVIQGFNPDFTSSGTVTVDGAIAGTVSKPTMQGTVKIANGSIAHIDLPSALSDLNGTLIFNQNRVQIETLTAHTGGGVMTFGGNATAYNRQLSFDLTVQGRGVRLRYPPGVSSTADADLHWLGTSRASTLSGDITINKLAITPGFDFGAYLARTSQTTALPQTNPLLNRVRLNVHVVTTPELQMQTAVVRLSGDADLQVRGTAAKAVLLGRADVIEGEAYFNGNKYHLERGDVTFTNPVATTPVVDLQASTHVRDYDVTLNLNGKVDTLSLTYRSEPPLPTADIVALLAFGVTTQSSQTAAQQQSGQSSFSQDTSNAILSAALNATVSNRAERLFGVSHIRFDPHGLQTVTSPITNSPAVTIEEQVKDNLTLTYSTDISQTSQQIIEGVYNISSNVSVVGLRDQNGIVSFYVRIRRRKK
ncbi:MAG TPA: translocation/assembly module TamB domain-containing protein [Terriglobales bacterium]|nr:translocation/assembly module TamB domain-containing protein [Terriglobales bacterium]